ncbi:Serpin-Z1 [Zea mays]|uniref:Serpin-Z1 n=1 Tax=Zea mays TaxID=4577 RepID=A0A1D6MQ86_MAIZE|nr:Serpin-Z1 [Zea mays]
MSSWHQDDHAAPTHDGEDGHSSQPFPVPSVTAAIANYLASQPTQHISQPQPSPPRWHNYTPLQQRPSHRPHRAAPAAPLLWAFSTLLSPPRSLSPWTAGPVVPGGEIPDGSPAGGGRAGDANGCLRLARRVGRKAAGEGRNFMLSPLSFHAALALVASGANGETQAELLRFLGSASLDELQHAAATRLVAALRGIPQTSFACGVWVDRRCALREEFADVAGAVYAAVAESVDFVSQAEEARQRINDFVKDATKGLIGAVLPQGSVGPSTVAVLANGLHFKGTWAQPFDPSRTFDAPFHLPGGGTVRAPFMTTTRTYAAVSAPGFIRRHTPACKVPAGRLMVPKFKFAYEFEASEEMRRLGVARAFEGGDFSGMFAGGGGDSVNGVYHKATVEVDEEGTVAAAATAVSICLSASAILPVDFVADRPFLFAVVEERSGAVLFFGHVVNPLAE